MKSLIEAITSADLRAKLPRWDDFKTQDIGNAKTGIMLFPVVYKLKDKLITGTLIRYEKQWLALLSISTFKIGLFEVDSKLKAGLTKYGALHFVKYNTADVRTSSVRMTMFKPVYARLISPHTKWLKSDDNIVTYDPELYVDFHVWLRTEVQTKEMLDFYNKANDLYHNAGKSPLTDQQFDNLGDMLEARKAKPNAVGAAPTRDKVNLPMPMGSQEKIKPDGTSLAKWLKLAGKSAIIKSIKYDGISCLLHYSKGRLTEAYTRGNGKQGRIITHQIKMLSVPDFIPDKTDLFVRAEIIMPKKLFQKYYSDQAENARSMVAGLLNRKQPIDPKIASHIHVIAFEIMNWKAQAKSTQLSYLKKLGFQVAEYTGYKVNELTEDKLIHDIADIKENGIYDSDGLVLDIDHAETRNKLGLETNSLNPKYARAFKAGEEESAVAVVTGVRWKVSKDGYIKPTVLFNGVRLAGSTVSKATGFNAKFINENRINVGSQLLIVKSGDVIPYIKQVITRSKTANAPDPKVVGNYGLNATGVDWVLTGKSEAVDLQRIIHFFETIGAFGVSKGLFTKLYDAGYTTLISIMKASPRQIAELPGLQKVSADKAYAAIHKALKNVQMPQLMDASGCFGRSLGETKLKIVYDKFGDKLFDGVYETHLWYNKVIKISGFSDKTANQFVLGLDKFIIFLGRHQNYIHIVKPEQKRIISDRFAGQTFTPTGFRDQELFDQIKAEGGNVSDALTKATTTLLTKDDKGSTKVDKARAMGGIKIMPVNMFRKKYGI